MAFCQVSNYYITDLIRAGDRGRDAAAYRSPAAQDTRRPMETPLAITQLHVVGARHGAELSQLAESAGSACGSAAPTCGKPAAFRSILSNFLRSPPTGRLSLPIGPEVVDCFGRPSERQSLSASQAAEPLALIPTNRLNLDMSDSLPPAPRAELLNEPVTQDNRADVEK